MTGDKTVTTGSIKPRSGVILLIFILLLSSAGCRQSGVRHEYFNDVIHGARLYYHIVTADPMKPHVFFLHGGPGGNSQQFEQIFPYLTVDRVNWVFMDQRGSGHSGVYHVDPHKSELGRDQLTPELMVEDIEAIRRKHDLGKIVIYGHSWGGNLAAYYTHKYPESLLGYIIASCSHDWQDNTDGLLDYHIYFAEATISLLENWIENGYSTELLYHLPQLKGLFEAQGNQDIVELIFLKETPADTLRVRLEQIVDGMKEIRSELASLRDAGCDAKKVYQVNGLTGKLGSYGWSIVPALDLNQFPPSTPMKPNSVREAWADSLPRDNTWYYPEFKVPGVFWCGFHDLWSPEFMIPASLLAPNSSYFTFPRSGHDYYISEPYLFVRKLTESIDTFAGVKRAAIDRSDWPLWMGLYRNSLLGECRVVIEGKNIVGYLLGSRIVLEPLSSNEFVMHGGPGSGGKLTVVVEPDGTCNTFVARGLTFRRATEQDESKGG